MLSDEVEIKLKLRLDQTFFNTEAYKASRILRESFSKIPFISTTKLRDVTTVISRIEKTFEKMNAKLAAFESSQKSSAQFTENIGKVASNRNSGFTERAVFRVLRLDRAETLRKERARIRRKKEGEKIAKSVISKPMRLKFPPKVITLLTKIANSSGKKSSFSLSLPTKIASLLTGLAASSYGLEKYALGKAASSLGLGLNSGALFRYKSLMFHEGREQQLSQEINMYNPSNRFSRIQRIPSLLSTEIRQEGASSYISKLMRSSSFGLSRINLEMKEAQAYKASRYRVFRHRGMSIAQAHSGANLSAAAFLKGIGAESLIKPMFGNVLEKSAHQDSQKLFNQQNKAFSTATLNRMSQDTFKVGQFMAKAKTVVVEAGSVVVNTGVNGVQRGFNEVKHIGHDIVGVSKEIEHTVSSLVHKLFAHHSAHSAMTQHDHTPHSSFGVNL